MTQYLQLAPDNEILQALGVTDPDGATPEPPPDDGYTYVLWQTAVDWARPTPTSKHYFTDGAPVWVEMATLADLISAAVAKCYTDIDKVVEDAVGGRTKEYERTESDARAFAAGGYVDPAPRSVSKFAQYNPTMQVQTNQWAADQIIGRADALITAQDDMRDQRFVSQYAMRAAATDADLDTAVTTWNDFIATTRQNLGLPPAS